LTPPIGAKMSRIALPMSLGGSSGGLNDGGGGSLVNFEFLNFYLCNLTSDLCNYFSSSSMAVISDWACWLPVRRAELMPSTSMRLASSVRAALAKV
jgi:hypothetical protein